MKKLFVSQPMRGKTPEEITKERERMIAHARETVNDEIEVLDTYYKDFNGNRVEFLGRSIGDLGKADIAIFAPGWENFDGCRCGHGGRRVVGENAAGKQQQHGTQAFAPLGQGVSDRRVEARGFRRQIALGQEVLDRCEQTFVVLHRSDESWCAVLRSQNYAKSL